MTISASCAHTTLGVSDQQYPLSFCVHGILEQGAETDQQEYSMLSLLNF